MAAFYARGGSLEIGASFILPQSTLQFLAQDNAQFDPSASLTVKNLNITGLQSVAFDGTANVASVFQLNGGMIEVGGNVTAQNSALFGSGITINGSVGGQQLTANSSGNFLLSSTGVLVNTNKIQITSSGIAQFDGTISAPMADVTVAGVSPSLGTPGVLVNGTLTGKSFDFEPIGDFLLNPTGTVTTNGNLKVNAANGAITLDGTLAGQNTSLTGTAVTVNGTVGGQQLTANSTGNFLLASMGVLTDTNSIQITAGGVAQFDGTISAPASNVTVHGAASSLATPGIVVNGSRAESNSTSSRLVIFCSTARAGSLRAQL